MCQRIVAEVEFYQQPIEVYYDRRDGTLGHGLAIGKTFRHTFNDKIAIFYLVDAGGNSPELISAKDVLPER